MLPQTRLLTLEDYQRIAQSPEYDGVRVELVHGALCQWGVMTGGTSPIHGWVVNEIAFLLNQYVRTHALGQVFIGETGFRLPSRHDDLPTVRIPDVAFVSASRLPPKLTEGYAEFPPDLAVEVISHGNDAEEIQEKVLDFLEAGVSLIWLVYPKTQSITVHTIDGAHIFGIADMLDGGDILSGLSIPVVSVFPKR